MEKKENNAKNSFFANLKSEFRKIVWPSRKSLYKQTITVSITSIGLGLVVFCYDSIFSALLRLIVR